MSEVFSVFFQGVPGVLFEPIAVGAVLGLVTAAVMYWKRHTPLYWLIGGSILFMISWRLSIQIISSRYAAILLYPAVIATAFFCFQTDWLVKYIPRFPEKWCKAVPYLFVLGLSIASIGQTLHLNPYDDYIIRAAELIKKDAAVHGESRLLTRSKEATRMYYYSGVPVVDVYEDDGVTAESFLQEAERCFKKTFYSPVNYVYIMLVVNNKSGEEPAYFQKMPECLRKNIVFLGEFFHNRKKRRKTQVYRYDLGTHYQLSMQPAVDIKSSGKPEYRFTFEKTYPAGDSYYGRIDDYFKTRTSTHQAPVLKDNPLHWSLGGAIGFAHGSNGQLKVIQDSQQRKLLQLNADKAISIHTSSYYPADNWRIKMKVTGKKDTIFNFAVHCWNAKKEWICFQVLPAEKISEEGKFYEYTCTIPEGFYLPETKYIRPTIYLTKGELFVHSIELYSEKK